MIIPLYPQHEDDVLKYTWDFSKVLISGETISTAEVTADSGMTAASATISSDSLKVTALLSGGDLYTTYMSKCKIVTSGGETINRSLSVQIVPL